MGGWGGGGQLKPRSQIKVVDAVQSPLTAADVSFLDPGFAMS